MGHEEDSKNLGVVEKYSINIGNGVRISTSKKPTYAVLESGYEAFLEGKRLNGDGNCFGHFWNDEYIWHSYNKAYLMLCDWGSGLTAKGLKPGSFVGVYAKNCMEWLICEFGCFRLSMVIVPLYDTLGPDVCKYCINHTELTLVLTDTEKKVDDLLDQAEDLPSLKTIVSISKVSENTLNKAKQQSIEIIAFEDVLAMGAEKPVNATPPKSEDLALIMYTSGTTGNPKGVMLSHANILNVSHSAAHLLGDKGFTKEDIFISFLPLAHTFEQDMDITAMSKGAAIGFTSGDITKLKNDFQVIKPTVSPMVPRLLNKIYDSALASVEKSVLKKKILNLSIKYKFKDVQKGIIRKDTIWDRLVFSKIQQAFGNNLRLIICGSAPVSSDVLKFSRCAFGCSLQEGYGQTENGGACTITQVGDTSVGHVGGPLHCASLKLADVPEMNYYSVNDEGEVCIKGPLIMMGYYGDAEKTAEAIDSDGWLHTGDVGKWLPNGALKIIDRKKHIFKLSQGEYVAPEKIENVYQTSKYIAQAFVHGESLQSCLVGIVVPEPVIVKSWANTNKVNQSFEELCQNQQLVNEILQDMIKIGKSAKLHSFEQVKAISLEPIPFSIENEMLTAIMKKKRNVIRKVYQQKFDEMYSTLI